MFVVDRDNRRNHYCSSPYSLSLSLSHTHTHRLSTCGYQYVFYFIDPLSTYVCAWEREYVCAFLFVCAFLSDHVHFCLYFPVLVPAPAPVPMTMAIHCNTLRHTTTRCNTLQHTATHCNSGTCCGHGVEDVDKPSTHMNEVEDKNTHNTQINLNKQKLGET